MPSDDTTTTTTLQTDLRRLGLNYTADQLNDLIALATRKRWSHTVLLEHIVAAELQEKQRRSVESRLKRARLGRFKPLADWDWDWPSALDRPALERILTLDFLGRSENLILVGAHGLGKTMLAKNIAHQAVLVGHTALFTTAADLLLDLNGQETARALERRLRHYTRPTLLVVDELPRAPDALAQFPRDVPALWPADGRGLLTFLLTFGARKGPFGRVSDRFRPNPDSGQRRPAWTKNPMKKALFSGEKGLGGWRARQDSNLWPSAPEAGGAARHAVTPAARGEGGRLHSSGDASRASVSADALRARGGAGRRGPPKVRADVTRRRRS